MVDTFKLFSNIQKHIVLNDAEKNYLTSILEVKEVLRKELILKQEQQCKKIYFVVSGSLRAFHINNEGKDSTIMFAIQDWWITDMYCFINQKPALVAIEALENCQLIGLDFSSLEMLYQKTPKFERFFRILFQNAYSREQLRALDHISYTTEERYYRFVHKYPEIVQKITQKQIASYLGVTPEFLSAIKKK